MYVQVQIIEIQFELLLARVVDHPLLVSSCSNKPKRTGKIEEFV
jgi:hypothetical protein